MAARREETRGRGENRHGDAGNVCPLSPLRRSVHYVHYVHRADGRTDDEDEIDYQEKDAGHWEAQDEYHCFRTPFAGDKSQAIGSPPIARRAA